MIIVITIACYEYQIIIILKEIVLYLNFHSFIYILLLFIWLVDNH